MTKLKLDIADLRVESFETTVERVGSAGVVFGQSWPTAYTNCLGEDTCGCGTSGGGDTSTCYTEASTCMPTSHDATNCHNECVE